MNESHDAAVGPDAPVARIRHAFLATLVSLIEWVRRRADENCELFLASNVLTKRKAADGGPHGWPDGMSEDSRIDVIRASR